MHAPYLIILIFCVVVLERALTKGALTSEKKTRGRFFFKAISAGLTNLPNQESHD